MQKCSKRFDWSLEDFYLYTSVMNFSVAISLYLGYYYCRLIDNAFKNSLEYEK